MLQTSTFFLSPPSFCVDQTKGESFFADRSTLQQCRGVDLAQDSDGVIAIIGLNTDWEAEGYDDRTTLALPGRTDEYQDSRGDPSGCVKKVDISFMHLTTPKKSFFFWSFYLSVFQPHYTEKTQYLWCQTMYIK